MPNQPVSSRYRASTGVTPVCSGCSHARHPPLPPAPPAMSPQFFQPQFYNPTNSKNLPPCCTLYDTNVQLVPPPHPPPLYAGLDPNTAAAAGASAGAAAAFGARWSPLVALPPLYPVHCGDSGGKSKDKDSSKSRKPGPQYRELKPKSHVLLHVIQVPEHASYKTLFEGRVREPAFTAHYIPTWAPTRDVLVRLGADKKGAVLTECIEWGDNAWGKGFHVSWGDSKAPATIGEWAFQTVGARDPDRPAPVWVVCHPA